MAVNPNSSATDFWTKSVNHMYELNSMLESKANKDSNEIRILMDLIPSCMEKSGANIAKCTTCELHTWTVERGDANDFWEAVCHRVGKCPNVPEVVPTIEVKHWTAPTDHRAAVPTSRIAPVVPISLAIDNDQGYETDQALREYAKELMRELNEMLNSRRISRDSMTAQTMMGLITAYLKQGGARIEKCSTCDLHEWKRNHYNDFWEVICHDPGKCPSAPRPVVPQPDLSVLRRYSDDFDGNGVSCSSVAQNDYGFFRRDSSSARRDSSSARRDSYAARFDLGILRR